jgi:hypothetical protein
LVILFLRLGVVFVDYTYSIVYLLHRVNTP